MKSLIHFCPFCHQRLSIWIEEYHTAYICDNIDCINDDMPRYQIIYNNYPTYLISHVFMYDKYYFQISYINQTTTISTLQGYFLTDTIEIPKVFPIDFDNLDEFLNKIKGILVFL